MSRGLNKVQIIGHLGKEPEMRYTPSGKPVTTFTVAVSRSWNTLDGERHNETEWFNEIVANEMMMLGERREHNNQAHPASDATAEESNMETNEDEFPF